MMRNRSPRCGGFSFTEILFAVMILGIGFIMIAAMFPVAIRQTEAGSQETIAAAVGRSSSNFLAELAGMPLPAGTLPGYNPAGVTTTQLPSILLPTIALPGPPASLPPASSFKLPVGQTTMIVPGQVWTFDDGSDPWIYAWSVGGTANHNLVLWQSSARNLILPGDMRFGWAPMYRRDLIVRGPAGSPGTSIAAAAFAQVIVIGMQCRTRQAYDPNLDLNVSTPKLPPTPFVPQRIGTLSTTTGVTISGTGARLLPPAFAGGPSYVDFSNTPGAILNKLAENTYVVISDDNVPWAKPSHGTLNGRILRLGAAPVGGSPWPLLPGSDLTTSDQVAINNMTTDLGGTAPQFNVLIVGRTPGTKGTFSGPAQDVTAYTTYLPIAN